MVNSFLLQGGQSALLTMHASHLGFGDPPVKRRVYCNRGHGGLWYFWDGLNKEAVSIRESAVTGYARALEIEEGEYKGKPTQNLLLTLDCGFQEYVLMAGAASAFAKGLVAALGAVSPEMLREAITVAPQAGDEEKVLLCRVWAGRTLIKAEWPESQSDFDYLIQAAASAIAHANGRSATSPPYRNTEIWQRIKAAFAKAKSEDQVFSLQELADHRIKEGHLPVAAAQDVAQLANSAIARLAHHG